MELQANDEIHTHTHKVALGHCTTVGRAYRREDYRMGG